MSRFVVLLSLWSLLLSSPLYAAPAAPGQAADAAGYAPADSCQGCHTTQAEAWRDSDHAWAMRVADEASVLGDFDDARFSEAGVSARFFRRDGHYYVNTEGEDGQTADFPIAYTFGHRPLQQYLVHFPGGRLQALTLAWDSRPKAQGGQRWFSLYPGQRFVPGDPLHWTGRYQNWNAMCADCHSSGLQKGYDSAQDQFATTWQEQTVGCQGCHGPAQAHVDWARNAASGVVGEALVDRGLSVNFSKLGSAGLVEQCAYCHSRRQPLGLGQQPGHPLLDAALPATLREGLYHADGQIQGEVYVYGSFLQSKMYAAGVGCTDCHEPHSGKVRIEGNGLCLQCHTPTPPARFAGLRAGDYDSPAHHHHAPGSAGAQCVNCHMPETTYMVVDPRRDHSLRIPRPDLTVSTASPDACSRCHQDQTPAWAAQALEQWFGQPQRPPHYGQTLHDLRGASGDPLALLTPLIRDLGKPAIVRASAVELWTSMGLPGNDSLASALEDPSGLVRAYAAEGFAGLPPVPRVRRLLPLLDDPLRAVRDQALRALAGIPTLAVPEAQRPAYTAAQQDYERRLQADADLPGGRLNLAAYLTREGRQQEAMAHYRQALRMDPYFSPARLNLVSLANQSLQPQLAEQLLREGLALDGMPLADHGTLAYTLALLLVEHGRAEEAAEWLAKAAEEVPENPRIRYNQGLLLLQLQQPQAAQAALEAGLQRAPEDADLLYALAYLHRQLGDRPAALSYWERLQQAHPQDPRVQPGRP